MFIHKGSEHLRGMFDLLMNFFIHAVAMDDSISRHTINTHENVSNNQRNCKADLEFHHKINPLLPQ